MIERRQYKKGYKKYSKDQRVMDSLDQLLNFVKSKSQKPRIDEYPPDLYVHALAADKRYAPDTLSAHMKGRKIVCVFRPDYQGRSLEMIGLGTHQDFGWR